MKMPAIQQKIAQVLTIGGCARMIVITLLAFTGGACRSNAMAEPPEGMRWIPAATYWMGSESAWALPEEGPLVQVQVPGFWMDEHEVTNREFAAFVKATGYVTTSEKPVPLEWVMAQLPEGSPAPSPEQLAPASATFHLPQDAGAGWVYQHGADWRHPAGPGSDIVGLDDHPVVHVTWWDAQAYAKWAGKALPTEAQWELAARGGLDRARYVWGDEPADPAAPPLNMWQGHFPHANHGLDGFLSTAPVGSFPANGYGLFDMAGNVWEWCANPFEAREADGLWDGSDPSPRALRGGSFLCSDDYCTRYRPSARIGNPPDSSTNHTGFRCVRTDS